MSAHLHHLCQTKPKYRRLFHGLPQPEKPRLTLNSIESTGSCKHRGEFVRLQGCKKCGQKDKQVEVFVCERHGREVSEVSWWVGQSREDQCRTCKLYEPVAPPETSHFCTFPPEPEPNR
jgi:hypothetical protein